MFGVGLHFSVRDLTRVYRVAIPGAIGQIAFATGLGTLAGLAFGWDLTAAVVLGFAVSVASTVVLMRALQHQGAMDTDAGHIAIGWLIVEDLFTVDLWDPKKLPSEMPVPYVILFTALAYVVGYGVQDIGGAFRISSTAVPYTPKGGGRCLYRAFTRFCWKPVDYADGMTPVEFEIEMGRQDISARTLQALDRILSLKVISTCIGASLILSAVFTAIHWFRSGRQFRDVVLFFSC